MSKEKLPMMPFQHKSVSLKAVVILTLGMAAVTSLGATASAQPKETKSQLAARRAADRKAIIAEYEKSAAAVRHNNLTEMMANVGHDFQYYDEMGAVQDRAAYERGQSILVQMMDRTKTKLDYAYKIKSITWRGDDAIVQVLNTTSGVTRGKKFSVKSTSRDFWSRYPDGWKIRQTVHRSISGNMNGILMQF